jgi:hypothetical protein
MYFFSRFTVVFLLAISLLPHTTFAQTVSGIGLKPSLIEEGADPGQVLQKSISLTNLSDNEQIYYLYTRDIATVRDGGTPVYADPDAEKTGYELTEWIVLGTTEVNLQPAEEVKIPVTINVPESATPGSHFGGIFVSMQPPKLRQVGASVGYEVANIVSIRISGDVTESAIIRSFRTDKLIYGSTNVEFMAEIENKGNVLIRPYGPVQIYNMFGKEVAQMTMNDSQGGVFPFTKRSFTISWEDDGMGFGRYNTVLSMIYGEVGRQSTISSTVSFWVLPMNIITPALIILAVLLLSSYIAVRMYVRRTIATMSGGRRLVHRRKRSGGTSTLLLVALVMLGVTAIFLILLLALFA